jgi:hypothetical protein
VAGDCFHFIVQSGLLLLLLLLLPLLLASA